MIEIDNLQYDNKSYSSLHDSGLILIKSVDLKVSLIGTTIEILPISRDSDSIIGLGVLSNSRLLLYLSNGTSTILSLKNWFIENIPALVRPIYLFGPEYNLLDIGSFNVSKNDIIIIKKDFSSVDIWGYLSYDNHVNNVYYRPYWAYQFANNPIYAEQILKFLELMLLNKLALIINHTVSMRIIKRLDSYICAFGESAVKLDHGCIFDIETTGFDKDTSTIAVIGTLTNNTFVSTFNYDSLNNNSFILAIKNHLIQNLLSPIYVYGSSLESTFFPKLFLIDIMLSKSPRRPRRLEVFLPNDDDPGHGKNIPVWYQLFLSGGNESKRRLYRRLILLHNKACLINNLCIVALHFDKVRNHVDLNTLQFPLEIVKKYRDDTTLDIRLLYKPKLYLDYYSYMDGKYSKYYDNNYLYSLSLHPVPENLRKLINNHHAKIRYYKHFEPQETSLVGYNSIEINTAIINELHLRGIDYFYEFQLLSWNTIYSGNHCIIVAPTGNGKTEAFLLPTLQRIIEIKNTNHTNKVLAIFLYPTKALANDQADKIISWADKLNISTAQIDGDLEKSEKSKIELNPPNLLITTPDWIHYNLSKKSWQDNLSELEIIVIDEIHVYEGTLGTHLFMLLKRLQRIVNFQILGASATIANPRELFSYIIDNTDFTLVECKSGKRPAIDLLMINYKDKYHSLNSIIESLLQDKNANHSILIFRETQQQAEGLYSYLKESFGNLVAIHRGGLDKEHRQTVEAQLKNGDLKIVVCTSTLELGLDIGNITTIITPLVPINHLFQRIGRAGRKDSSALVLVELSLEDPISEFYINNPVDYFKDITPIVFSASNEIIISKHLILASMELPLSKHEFLEYFSILENLIAKNILTKDENDNIIPVIHIIPFPLRDSYETVDIMYNNVSIATRQLKEAYLEYYPYNIRIINGNKYIVDSLIKVNIGLKHKWIANVHLYNEPEKYYFSKPIIQSDYTLIQLLETKTENKSCLSLHSGIIINKIIGSEINIGFGESKRKLFNPLVYKFKTFILNIQFQQSIDYSILHTLQHLIKITTKMILGIDEFEFIKKEPNDSIIIYDSAINSNGICQIIYQNINKLFLRMKDILTVCNCKSITGCPHCIHNFSCNEKNEFLNKNDTLNFIKEIMSLN